MRKIANLIILLLLSISLYAATSWQDVEPATITAVKQEGNEVTVFFHMPTGKDGADKGKLTLYDADGNIVDQRAIGRSKHSDRNLSFELTSSGVYQAEIISERKKESEKKISEKFQFTYTLPLKVPNPKVKNLGDGKIEITIYPVKEADKYAISIRENDGEEERTIYTESTDVLILDDLDINKKYEFTSIALRNNETATSDSVYKTVKAEAERDWNFTFFGQSSKESLNTFKIIDGDNLTIQLNSTTYNPETSQVLEKGGKFTAFHDGISYYYTEFDPKTENFELSATFTINYINPTADGQEGFGILAMDSLGEHGRSDVNHYTNSAGIIATKFEEHINGTKKTSKDTLGARFVTGITHDAINGGDDLIAKTGTSVSHAFSYDGSDLVKAGDIYRITLKKDNTGYHAIFKQEIASEDTIEKFTLYGPEKLEVLDSEKSYVGFAVARGCNVTVSDIQMKITNPLTDPAREEEPDELIPLEYKVDSPSSYHGSSYPFVFVANADGKLTITDNNRVNIIDGAKVVANKDFTTTLQISQGFNDYQIVFSPDPTYKPGEKQTMASYDKETKRYKEDYSDKAITFSVIKMSYPGKYLYASPEGSVFGSGSYDDPLDIESAIRYVKPGQAVVLKEGRYYPSRQIIIERGHNGHKGSEKRITTENGKRAIIDFSYAKGGMQLWGDWWIIENIDITNTYDNVKGLQIAGDWNIIRNVHAYNCGDTGIQISGTSNETYPKWPHHNLVELCISHDNKDPAENNADGFAAKLTVGDGNRFNKCIAYSNIDDGWDLFSKIESGPIGAVVIENCIAYKNGSLSDGRGNGDGNGFKMGGDGIAVEHRLINSLAFNNGKAGVTSNSNPSLQLENVTSVANNGKNIALYGKGNGERFFSSIGVLSVDGAEADEVEEIDKLKSENNYFYDGANGVNSLGKKVGIGLFKSTSQTTIPTIIDSEIELYGLYSLIDKNFPSGAKL